MWAWLNPKNLIQILSLVKGLIDLAIAAYEKVKQKGIDKAQEEKLEQIKESEEALKEADKIPDDKERFNEKAKRACELEKHLNPNSDC